MKLEINLSVFAPEFYPDAPANKVVLEGQGFAVRERDGCLDAVAVISEDNTCKLPFHLISPDKVQVKATKWGITWKYLVLKYKKASISFWERGLFWERVRNMLLAESSVFVEDEQFLKGTPEILEKYMIRVV